MAHWKGELYEECVELILRKRSQLTRQVVDDSAYKAWNAYLHGMAVFPRFWMTEDALRTGNTIRILHRIGIVTLPDGNLVVRWDHEPVKGGGVRISYAGDIKRGVQPTPPPRKPTLDISPDALEALEIWDKHFYELHGEKVS